jgi:asparagine synthase (glutamine-hydrolysing)
MRVDKMTMGASLEARVPFLDHKFVELVMSIPTTSKQGNGELKYMLKKAVRGLIPDDIIARKKQGFAVPVSEWFFDRLGQYARAEIQSFCRDAGLLDWPAVMQLLDRRDGKRAWYLLNLALWWKQSISQPTKVASCAAG